MDPEIIDKLRNAPVGKVMEVPVAWLWPAEYNPRKISDENLEALRVSIKAKPQLLKINSLWVNIHEGREGCVFVGSRRLQVVQEEEWEKVPCTIVDVSEEEERALNIMHNTHAGDWDPDLRREVFVDLHSRGYDMQTLGMNPKDVVSVMGSGMTLGGSSPEESGPGENGTTPSKELTCPNCGHIDKKKNFKTVKNNEE